jgi:hypothetical protein
VNSAERIAQEYLLRLGYERIEYEPDGNVPPDFLVDGSIAVEVRKLNQNHVTADGVRGLEHLAVPLERKMDSLLKSFHGPTHEASWFVLFTFRRPVPEWKQLRKMVTTALGSFDENSRNDIGDDQHYADIQAGLIPGKRSSRGALRVRRV